MSGLAKGAKSGFLYMSQTAISTLLPLITLLIITRFVSPAEFGEYAIALVYAVVVTGVMSLGLHVGYERNYYQYKESVLDTAKLFYTVILVVFVLYVFTFLITILFFEYTEALMGDVDKELVLLVFGGMCLERLVSFFLIFYKSSENPLFYFFTMVFSAVINFCISLYLIVIEGSGIQGLAIGYLFAWWTVFCVVLYLFSRKYRFAFCLTKLMEVLKISLPVLPRSMTVVMGSQSDKYMLNNSGDLGLGHYSLAGRLASVLNSYMVALQNVYVPILYNALFSKKQSEIEKFEGFLSPIIFLSIFPAIILAAFSYEMVYIFFPDDYLFMSPILSLLSVYYGVIFFGKISGNVLTYSKRTGLASLLAVGGAGLNIALNIPMIFHYGAMGAALATVLTGSFVTFVGVVLAQKEFYLSWDFKFVFYVVFLLLVASFLSVFPYFNPGVYDYFLFAKVILLLGIVYLFFLSGLSSLITPMKIFRRR